MTFECVGRADSLSEAVRFTRAGGRVVAVGMPGDERVDWAAIWQRELTVMGAYAYGSEPEPEGPAHVRACPGGRARGAPRDVDRTAVRVERLPRRDHLRDERRAAGSGEGCIRSERITGLDGETGRRHRGRSEHAAGALPFRRGRPARAPAPGIAHRLPAGPVRTDRPSRARGEARARQAAGRGSAQDAASPGDEADHRVRRPLPAAAADGRAGRAPAGDGRGRSTWRPRPASRTST